MKALLRHRTTLIWAILVVATCISWESANDVRLLWDQRMATALVMIVAFVKVRLIILEFMEVRHAPVLLRLFAESWTVIVCAATIAVYWGQV